MFRPLRLATPVCAAACLGVLVQLGPVLSWAQAREGQLSEGIQFQLTEDSLKLASPSGQAFWAMALDEQFVGYAAPKIQYKYGGIHFKERDSVRLRLSNWRIEQGGFGERFLKLSAAVEDRKQRLTCHFEVQDKHHLSFKVYEYPERINRIGFTIASPPEAAYFGAGEQTQLNLKGHRVPILTEEQGLGRGDPGITWKAKLVKAAGDSFTSYKPLPYFMSSNNRAFFLDDYYYKAFDFRRPGKIGLEVWADELEAEIWLGDQPADLLTAHTAETGRMPALPDWAYGTWMGIQGGTERVRRILAEARAAGNPVKAAWVQDWTGRRQRLLGSLLMWWWRVDTTRYPGFHQFMEYQREQGTRILTYINSFLALNTPMYERAKRAGYLIQNDEGEPYKIKTAGFPAGLVDLSNPEAYQWLKEIIIRRMAKTEMGGWMADYGEWLPPDANFHKAMPGLYYHNRYPVMWARLNREVLEQTDQLGEKVFFSRSGNAYSNRYSTLFWCGDQMVGWGRMDGFRSVVPMLLSSGLSGLTLNHADIGGYTTVNLPLSRYHRSRELLYRWIELSAFTPIYRTHEGLAPERNHQVYSDSASIEFFAEFGQLHYALKDYFQQLVRQASDRGIPPIRPLYLHYSQDTTTYELEQQFLMGRDMLVCPVVHKGAKQVRCYLPEAGWTHALTGEVYDEKGWHTIDAPIGQPCVLLRRSGEAFDSLQRVFQKYRPDLNLVE